MRATVVFFALLLFVSCKQVTKQVFKVKYTGALKDMMSGDISKTIDLDTLSKKEHLYAIGAYENLKGEIQIFNGAAFNSRVKDSLIAIENNFTGSASLLVYTQVEEWVENYSFFFASKTDLERLLIDEAKRLGIDVSNPFPFIIEGTISELQWHVINWDANDTIHKHQKHQNSGINETLRNEEVVILGFYSTQHKAIFTHHSSNTHIHFRTKDQSLAGHVDALKINDSITLKLPKL